jgi:hypothetical protein
MTDASAFERRIAALLGTIADQMPADVDPMAMTRMAAATQPPGLASLRFGAVELSARLGVVALTLALLGAFISGALVAGGFLERTPRNLLSTPVAPFIGLPPQGAAPSEPASGELVAGDSGIHPWFAVYVYADGRVISAREDGSAWGTTGWREQHLTEIGVDLLRSGAVAPDWREIRDSGTWLPAAAWADARLGAYVPARYAICLWYGLDRDPRDPAAIARQLPAGAQVVLDLADRAYDVNADGQPGGMRCHDVVTTDAHAFDAALAGSGIVPIVVGQNWIEYRVPGPDNGHVWIIPLLPHGAWSWAGG